MCGLVGIASQVPQIDKGWLSSAKKSMSHRGPDDSGECWVMQGRVGLAHCRLSILELTDLGHQPMAYPELGLSIVFNGEIYNYLELRDELKGQGHYFRSKSDTEVLLAAYSKWGTDCLSHLNGMFSFAISDDRNQTLFLARDRAGEKPLFYRLKNKSIYFASEIKALLVKRDLPKKIDLKALDCYLSMGYVPGEQCILEGYNKLPPAHAMLFDIKSGEANIWPYWHLPDTSEDIEFTGNTSLINNLEELLQNAVNHQLVADVPLGVLLSGGMDSSLITALASRSSSKLTTFSIGFKNHGKYDETPHARLIAKHFGTEHIELMAEPATANLLPSLVKQFDEPMVDSSMFPTWLVTNLVGKHCKVALGGDGGDELFGGYSHYSKLLLMQKRFKSIPKWLCQASSYTSKVLLPIGMRGRDTLQGLNIDLEKSLPIRADFFDSITRRRLMKGVVNYELKAEKTYSDRLVKEDDLIQRATRMDFYNYLSEDILVKIDRAGMLNSLELRSPFLDYKVIEFAFKNVPSYLKANINSRKILLKGLADKLLPKEFDKDRKQGFSIPLNDWLKSGPFRDLFWDVMNDSNCMFDRQTVQSLLNWQDRGQRNSERIFSLVQFELWRKEYGATI